ncbi:MAG: sulfurtransferase TusA family protein [Chitinispirillaceae bacterium]|nr:sulfurtransferase TusA family protein [Chitinispirillaceae bacterium]
MLTYTIPPNLIKEIDEIDYYINQFKSGKIDESELKSYRVPFGIYEQRIKGLFMIRVRCAAGIITPSQLSELGKIAIKYGNGKLHLTTRQEIQIHDVKIDNIINILKELYNIGLSSRGGGGNTVRNITASWDSGIGLHNVFDVAPYAVELTNRMIADHTSWLLPRKFKIAFSNSTVDNAYATVNDLGFIAIKNKDKLGFKVFVAGGLGRMPKVGKILHDFVPPNEVYEIAEAIKRIFLQYGNRKNRHSARLRFLWESLGKERFFKIYEEKRKEIVSENHLPMPLPEEYIPNINEDITLTPLTIYNNNFELWKNRFVKSQLQKGLYTIIIPLENGNINSEKIIALAEIIKNIGNDTIRFTQSQNISLRNVPEKYLGNLYSFITESFELSKEPQIFSNIVACAGATTCQLGLCNSRGVLSAVIKNLKELDINLDKIPNVKINISGCPNSCGQHLLSDIGFFGKVGYLKGKPYPAYNIVVGSRINGEKGSLLATKCGEIPALNLPIFLKRILALYSDKVNKYDSFYSYLQQEGTYDILSIVKELNIVDIKDDKIFYDWDSKEEFSLKDRREGECAAGIFDIIEHDLDLMRSNLKSFLDGEESNTTKNFALETIRYACRSLLITKGVEATTNDNIFDLFEKYFIKESVISNKFQQLIDLVKISSDNIVLEKEAIKEFVDEIERLYQSLDETLQFQLKPKEIDFEIKKEADLRGVKCPLNFVKVKAILSEVKKGDNIKIILDEGEPSDNVPKSVELEGHKIVEIKKLDNSYSFIIKKC